MKRSTEETLTDGYRSLPLNLVAISCENALQALPVIHETEDIYRIATLHQTGLAVSEQREYDVGVSQLE